MKTERYLAYGSNLHPLRLTARVPSSRVVDVVEIRGHSLAFHKRGADRSGKCLLYPGQGGEEVAYGVMYEFDARERVVLDRIEGDGYRGERVSVTADGEPCAPYLYMAQETHIDPALLPLQWYKEMVLAGAYYHDLPAGYTAQIEATPARADPVPDRARRNEALLRQMGLSKSRPATPRTEKAALRRAETIRQ